MIDGTEPIHPQIRGAIHDGITIKQHMVIEFTKALLSREDSNPHYEESRHSTVSLAISHANEVIKQLNDEDK